jgi:transposase
VSDSSELPNDVETLQRLVLEQQAEIESHQRQLQTYAVEINSRQLEIERLKLVLAKLRRLKFGQRSEQLDLQISQLELTLEDLEASQFVSVNEASPAVATPRGKPVRKPLPEHLPREEMRYEPLTSNGCTCPDCGGTLQALEDDVSEVLERIPSRFKVIRHIRPKFGCRSCQKIIQARAPARPIERGLAGPALLAHVLVSKFADHLPLYRQSQIYAREGVQLERSTLADWVGGATRVLEPLVESIGQHVLAAEKLHADDTPVPVLSPGKGTTKTGRLWVYVRDDQAAGDQTPPAVLFRYTPDRKAIHPQSHLRAFSGIVQADAYAGFNALYERTHNPAAEAACWAHARRKFFDVHAATDSPIAREALERIASLYQIEEEIRGRLPAERQTLRQARAGPLLESLHTWMLDALRTLSKKSELAVAIRYSLSRWVALTRYRDDGRIEIDNNAAERALRAVALGRKNYLFAGSDSGGERAAAMYTIIGTAKLCGLDPQAYLQHVLTLLPAHPSERIEELLPWNVDAAITGASTQSR